MNFEKVNAEVGGGWLCRMQVGGMRVGAAEDEEEQTASVL